MHYTFCDWLITHHFTPIDS